MNEMPSTKFESKTTTHCIQPTTFKTMNTTQAFNTGVAISLAQKTSPSTSAKVAHPAKTSVASRKTLVLGALAVASCTAAVLCFKAAMVINEVFAALDATYKDFYT
jgi:hypothetical protein